MERPIEHVDGPGRLSRPGVQDAAGLVDCEDRLEIAGQVAIQGPRRLRVPLQGQQRLGTEPLDQHQLGLKLEGPVEAGQGFQLLSRFREPLAQLDKAVGQFRRQVGPVWQGRGTEPLDQGRRSFQVGISRPQVVLLAAYPGPNQVDLGHEGAHLGLLRRTLQGLVHGQQRFLARKGCAAEGGSLVGLGQIDVGSKIARVLPDSFFQVGNGFWPASLPDRQDSPVGQGGVAGRLIQLLGKGLVEIVAGRGELGPGVLRIVPHHLPGLVALPVPPGLRTLLVGMPNPLAAKPRSSKGQGKS